MPPQSATLLTAFAALAAVLVLIWLAARAARLAGFRPHAAAGRMLHVLDSIPIDAKRRLYLVACGEWRVLLLAGGGADVLLRLPGAEPAAPDPAR